MKKLLLVDDDARYSGELKALLARQNFHVETAGDAKDALQLLQHFSFDFVLLDWNLPDMTGLQVCQTYRGSGGRTPIIFLTGRHDINDKEAALDTGGDDYITKPFDVRELLARMRSIERRTTNMQFDKLCVQGVELDPKLRIAKHQDQRVRLSQIETEILEYLLKHPNSYHTAAQLFEAIWPLDTETTDDVVRVHVKLLRRRLIQIGADKLIETVRGAGYIIHDNAKSE